MNLEQLDALSQKVAKALYIIENLKAEKVNLQTKIDSLETELQTAQSDQGQVAELQAQLESQAQELESNTRELEELKLARDEMAAQNQELQHAISEYENANQEFEERNNFLTAELEELKLEVEQRQTADAERDQVIQEAQDRLQGMLNSLEGVEDNLVVETPQNDNSEDVSGNANEASVEEAQDDVVDAAAALVEVAEEVNEHSQSEEAADTTLEQEVAEVSEEIIVSSGETFEFISEDEFIDEEVHQALHHQAPQSEPESPTQDLFGNLSNQPFIVEDDSPNEATADITIEDSSEDVNIEEPALAPTLGESYVDGPAPSSDVAQEESYSTEFIETPLAQEVLETENSQFVVVESEGGEFQSENFQTYSVESGEEIAEDAFETEEILEVDSPSEDVVVMEDHEMSEETNTSEIDEWVDDWDEDVSSVSQSPQAGTDFVEEDGVVWSGDSDPTEEEH